MLPCILFMYFWCLVFLSFKTVCFLLHFVSLEFDIECLLESVVFALLFFSFFLFSLPPLNGGLQFTWIPSQFRHHQ